MQTVLPTVNCPNLDYFAIQGSPALDGTPMQTDSNMFEFVVMSCPQMNNVRVARNLDPIACATDLDIE